MRLGALTVVLVCLMFIALGSPSSAESGSREWPALKRGEVIEKFGSASIPAGIVQLQLEGDCDDQKDESGKLLYPRVSFFRTNTDDEFAVVACSGIHNEVTGVYGRIDDKVKLHSFATTLGEGFFSATWLANASIADPGTGKIESFWRNGACEDAQDFYYTYVFRDGEFQLIQVESRDCNGGPWKTIYLAQ